MTRVSMEQNRVPWRRTGEPPSDGEWEENTQGRDVYIEIRDLAKWREWRKERRAPGRDIRGSRIHKILNWVWRERSLGWFPGFWHEQLVQGVRERKEPFVEMAENYLGLVRSEVPLKRPGREATEAPGSPDPEVGKRCSLEM